MDVLKHESCTLNKLSLLVRIDNFPSFITSKARHKTRDIIVNNTRWYIVVGTRKWPNINETSIISRILGRHPDQPEFLALAAYIAGRGEEGIDCAFDVEAKFKFKQPHPMDDKNELTKKFCFNSSNGYEDAGWGIGNLAEINVVFTFFFKNLKCTLFLKCTPGILCMKICRIKWYRELSKC